MKILFERKIWSAPLLEEDLREVQNEPKTVSDHTDQTFRTQLCGETPSVIEGVKDERSEL